MDQSRDNSRPDPDALLARVEAEEPQRQVGRLKVFFGMCPGVGKTFSMLQEAQERRRSGTEVVLGYIETHARPETDALKADLEELPPRWVEYRGVRLREFDLDAALRRKPNLILVDELAHTNAEGLRHTKRWQDVIELLDAGIDVYSTINVQHVESLNDVVAQITGVAVRETVPDSIIERANEIELIDTPPDELLQRLHEGKVYVHDQIARAVQQFFRRENLVALRELALRETAARVGAQVLAQRAGRGDARPWATADRILACVGPSPLSGRVIRTARRMAAASHADWIAVSVETPGQSEKDAGQLRRNLQLAERLGAETTVLDGERIVDEILAFATTRNVTKIVIGKPEMPRWREWLRGSIVDDLIRGSGEIDVHVVKGDAEVSAVTDRPTARRPTDWRQYAWTVVVMAVCTAIAGIMFEFFSPVNLTMIYLAGVVLVSSRFNLGPSVLASFLAALLFDFLYTEPYFTFAISDAQYVFAFLVLLITGLVVSGLTQRVRRQVQAGRERYLRTVALYFMSRQLAGAADASKAVQIAVRHVADVFHGDTAVLLPDSQGNLTLSAHHGDFRVEPANESAAAQWVLEHQQWAGWSTETLSAAAAMYVPIVTSEKAHGVLALRPKDRAHPLEPDQRHLLETFATQMAIALDRAQYAQVAEQARIDAESEQLRNAMLSCVSHDLRTPLAAIAGSASTLLENRDRMSDEQQKELLKSIYDEGTRMNQLVGKLLEMSRLESPGLKLNKEWYPLEDIVGSALTRLEESLRSHVVKTHIDPAVPLVKVDGVLMEEVLVNLLENAARYTPAGSIIDIAATNRADDVQVEVTDNGPGLQPGNEERLFERFVRDRPSTDRLGTGLGLTICRAIIDLHGGKIGARNQPQGGACYWFNIPKPAEPAPSAVDSGMVKKAVVGVTSGHQI